jgi:hypothetical protein
MASISGRISILILTVFALFGCANPVPGGDAGRPDATTSPTSSSSGAHAPVLGIGIPIWPFTINGQDAGTSPNLGFPTGNLGQVYTTLDAGGGGVTAGWADASGGGSSVTGTGVWYSASGTLNSSAVSPSGDLSTSALSGSNLPFTVVGLQGRSVSSSAPSTGNTLGWNGSAWAPGALNLAGGSNYVSGTLPVTNLPNGSGDWTGAITSNVVQQCTGAAGVCTVPNGTNLSFATTALTSSTAGRINFPKFSGPYLAFRNTANSADLNVIANDGSDDITFGSSAASSETVLQSGFAVELLSHGNSVTVGSTGLTVNTTSSVWQSTPIFFDSGSDITLGATSADKGGCSGGCLDLAPVTTPPTALPTTHIGAYNANGQLFGVNANGITMPYELTGTFVFQQQEAPSTSGGSGSSGNQLNVVAQAGQAVTGASNDGGTGGVLLARSAGGGNSALANGGNAGNGEFGAGSGGAATGGSGNGGNGGDTILFGGLAGTSSGGSAGTNGTVHVRLAGVAGSDYLVVGSQTTSSGTDNFVEVERAGATRWQLGSVVGTTSLAAIYGPGVTPGVSNYLLDSNGTSVNLNAASGGQVSFSVNGSTANAGFFDLNGMELFNGTTPDYGSGVGVLGLGAANTVPTVIPSSGIVLYGTSGQRLGINGTGILFTNSSTGTITIQQLALASVAGGGGGGNELDVLAQQGQPVTGASNNGGAGGIGKFQSATGGTSALAQGGAGGVGYFGAGNGGNATGGSGNGGAGGDAIIYSGNGGTSSGGTAGATGALHLRVGGQNVGQDVMVLGGGVSANTNQGTGLGLQSTTFLLTSATGNNTPTYAVTQFPIIKLSTFTCGVGCTLVLPNVAGGYWYVDIGALTIPNGLVIKSGSGTCGTLGSLATNDNVIEVITYGSNTCTLNL